VVPPAVDSVIVMGCAVESSRYLRWVGCLACWKEHTNSGRKQAAEIASRVQVVRTLVENRCSMSPILSGAPWGTDDVPTVLHIATLSGVLACLMRHFRASLASLPLLQQPLASMPIGSWSPDSPIGQQGQAPALEV
jgi:hypothetical protein